MTENTYDTNTTVQEKAILVGIFIQRASEEFASNEASLQELKQLAETAKVQVLDMVLQNRHEPDAKYVVGKGKLYEIKDRLIELGGNIVIFDHELTGSQVRNLEQFLDAKIIDRTQLILDIFAQRARTKEGKLQVEVAQLSYLLPRLAGHYTNLSRLGGGIGTRGPGETKIETDRRHIRNRLQELKRQLTQVSRHRSLHRERRAKNGVIQVALVGYTNAGKSTLLHQLTGADSYIENQLFATLDPTTRTMKLPGSSKDIVITDTVGFIQRLPHDLIAAFRATLEEVCEADLIIHVVDGSSAERDRHIEVVNDVLRQLGAHDKNQLLVLNKMDLVSEADDELQSIITIDVPYLRVSAFCPQDIERLKLFMQEQLFGQVKTYRFPISRGDLQALVHQIGEVQSTTFEKENVVYEVRVIAREYVQVGYKLEAYEIGREEK